MVMIVPSYDVSFNCAVFYGDVIHGYCLCSCLSPPTTPPLMELFFMEILFPLVFFDCLLVGGIILKDITNVRIAMRIVMAIL